MNIPKLHSFHTKGGIVGIIVNPSGSIGIDRIDPVLSPGQRYQIAIAIAIRYHGSHTPEFEQLRRSIVSVLKEHQAR